MRKNGRIKIYIVMKCNEFIENNDNISIDCIFESLDDARRYIKGKCGIFDSPQRLFNSCTRNNGLLFEVWDGYEIQEHEVIPESLKET